MIDSKRQHHYCTKKTILQSRGATRHTRVTSHTEPRTDLTARSQRPSEEEGLTTVENSVHGVERGTCVQPYAVGGVTVFIGDVVVVDDVADLTSTPVHDPVVTVERKCESGK